MRCNAQNMNTATVILQVFISLLYVHHCRNITCMKLLVFFLQVQNIFQTER
jgi:hypothetical protein